MRIWTPLRRVAPFGLAFALLGAGLTWHGESEAPVAIEAQARPAQVAEHAIPVLSTADRHDVGSSDERSSSGRQDDSRSDSAHPEPTSAPAAPGEGTGATAGGTVVAALPATAVKPFSMVGVVWDSGVSDAADVEVQWHGRDGWSDWTSLDVESAEEGRPGTEPQWVDRADAAAVRVVDPTGASTPKGLSLTTVDPGSTPTVRSAAAAVGQPAIVMRSQWGARASNGCSSPRYGNATRGAVLHHTAGSNTYTKAQSAGIVKATQAYHMQGRDWCDLGYNFLVDRYGQIFEGRSGGITRPVRAAHSGNDGVNREAFGVSMMGTFTSVMPTEAQRKAVTNLIAWRFSLAKLPARGRYTIGGVTVERIAGHRDVKSTECPGVMAYRWLNAGDGLRTAVARRLASKPIATQPARLSAPRSLKVTSRGQTAVGLMWQGVSGATSYRVQLSRSSTFSAPATRTISATSGVVKGLKARTRYYLRVMALGRTTSQTSAASSPVAATTFALVSPPRLKASKTTTTSLTVTWDAVKGARRYVAQLSGSSAMSRPRVVRTTSRSVTFGSLKPQTKYWFRVAVKNTEAGDYESAYTARPYASATTAAPVNRLTLGSKRSFVLDGRGYGHGIGMSQYGAEGAARQGKQASQILAHYYPGTSIGTTSRDIRVLITADTTPAVTVAMRSGLHFRQGTSGTRRALPARTSRGSTIDQWSIMPSGTRSTVQFHAKGAWHRWGSVGAFTGSGQFDSGSAATSLVLPSGSRVAYRGVLRSIAPSAGSSDRQTVNALGIDDYTRGVIPAEMPPSWHLQALRSQAIAARTYGLRLMDRSRYYDVCDTTSCQVYGGASRETSRTNEAVKSTARKVLLKNGAPVLTQFSSSSGGWTNAGSESYLRAVADPWDGWSGNANRSWSVRVQASTVERAFPSIGTLRSMTVVKRNGHGAQGGRVVSLRITGSRGTRTVTGPQARFGFGLKSDWFAF